MSTKAAEESNGPDIYAVRDIADAVWLMEQMGVQFVERQPADTPTPPQLQIPDPATEIDRNVELPPTPPDLPKRAPHIPVQVATGPSVKLKSGRRVPVRPIDGLRDLSGISRSLRAFKRTVPSPYDHVLDEELTAHRSAEAKLVMPEHAPKPERWVDLALVVDTSTSMAIWQETVRDFHTLVRQHGAFRDVRAWNFNGDSLDVHLFPGLGGPRGYQGSGGRRPAELCDPSGRRLIVVLTDGVGPLWRMQTMAHTLDRWWRANSLIIFNLLPFRLWHRTGLPGFPVTLHSRNSASIRPRVRPHRPAWWGDDGHTGTRSSIPVAELRAKSIDSWAAVVTGSVGSNECYGVAAGTGTGQTSTTERESISPEELVKEFKIAASSDAVALAGHLAAAPLTLPVMRLVQAAAMPSSSPGDLAEVFLSGLLRRQGPQQDAHAQEVVYDFLPGVREELLATLSREQTITVLQVLRTAPAAVSRRFGGTLDIRALIADPDGGEALPPDSTLFATVAVVALQALGGAYANLAQRIVVPTEGTGTQRVPADAAQDARSRVETPFDVVSIPISAYRHPVHPPLPDADEEAERLIRVLAEIGGMADRWDLSPEERHRVNVDERLHRWANVGRARSSLVFWMGHGASDGAEAYLATYDTGQPLAGTRPQDLARHILAEWRWRAADDGAWAIVVIEAAGAKRFAQRLGAELMGRPNPPERLAVIGVGSDGAGQLGQFRHTLESVISSYTDNDEYIRLDDLIGRVRGRLHEGWVQDVAMHEARPLLRRRMVDGALTTTMDAYAKLGELLNGLTLDERSHFIPKAQGAGHGELAWYFVGRGAERAKIASWLRTAVSGMLIVTGQAGSGKSALLGNVLVHANPDMRALLTEAGQLEVIPDEQRPPDRVFDAVIQLTGVTTGELVHRLTDAAGLPHPPATIEPGQDVETLLTGLGDRHFCIMVDALDEAQEPAAIASSVLRRIAALPHGRVVIGTRRFTGEGPNQPHTTDADLLDALGRTESTVIVEVGRDSNAIATYVRRRLTAAERIDLAAIERVARLLSENHGYLFAHLAVHEIIARPTLMDSTHSTELTELLSNGYRALFAAAVDRLTAAAPVNFPLLEALAMAQGRGLPRADRIWAIVATALTDEAAPNNVTETDIDMLLTDAAPYLTLDAEGGQSVYRLSNMTFTEHFRAGFPTIVERHRRIASGLITSAESALPALPNSYIVRYLPAHVATANTWSELAASDLLDYVSPDAVVSEASGHNQLPEQIAAVVAARAALAVASPDQRAGIRRRAARQLAENAPRSPQRTLIGHTSPVRAMVPVLIAPKRTLLVSLDDNGELRTWDTATGRMIDASAPRGHSTGIVAATALHMRDGSTLLAIGWRDGLLQLWDPATGEPVHGRQAWHSDGISAVAAVTMPDGRPLLATGSPEGILQLWDPIGGEPAGGSSTNSDGISAVAAVTISDGRPLLATGGREGTVRLWDSATWQPVGAPLVGHDGPITALTTLSLPDGGLRLVSASADGTVRLWDTLTGELRGHLRGHTGAVTSAVWSTLPDGTSILASGGVDSSVRLWEPSLGRQLDKLTVEGGPITAIVGISDTAEFTLAIASDNGTIEISGYPHSLLKRAIEGTEHTRVQDESVEQRIGTIISGPRLADPKQMDAVIVVPTIMGSELVDVTSGQILWGLSSKWYIGVWTGGAGISALQVTDEERAGRPSRIRATQLLRFPAFAPVLRSVEPYTALVKGLRDVVPHEDAIAEFPYDWRLSVEHNAQELAKFAEQHLRSWRAHRDGSRDAQLVLVGHGLGGLIARYFTDVLGGTSEVRSIIALGTPFYGAVKVAQVLAEGDTGPLALPKRRMRAIFRTLPGLYDMLPSYRCVEHPDGLRHITPSDIEAIGGDSELASDAERSRLRLSSSPAGSIRSVVGIDQPTAQSIVINSGTVISYQYILARGAHLVDHKGDGIVPKFSAELEQGTTSSYYLPQTNAGLAKSSEVISILRSELTSRQIGPPL